MFSDYGPVAKAEQAEAKSRTERTLVRRAKPLKGVDPLLLDKVDLAFAERL